MSKETLEEAVKSYCEKEYSTPKPLGICIDFAKLGANWQAERMYSEEEVLELVDGAFHIYASSHIYDAKEWLIEQFKNK